MDIDIARGLHRETFMEVFQLTSAHHFGNGAGVDDGNHGVQWNAWVDVGPSGCVGVNLEGLEYDGWPVARLIEREFSSFSLFRTMTHVNRPDEITVRWSRDAWGPGGSRLPPTYPEHLILRVPLNDLTQDDWRRALVDAQACLNPERGFRGRARQQITGAGGTRVLHWVTPHLQFVRELWRDEPPHKVELAKLMRNARTQLLPIYRVAASLASRSGLNTEADIMR